MVAHRRHRHLRALTLGVFATGWTGLAACASTPAAQGAPRTAAYLRAVSARVEVARDEQRFVLRHNPAPCDCPAFEVRLGDVWQRVELVGDADDPTILAVDNQIQLRPESELTVVGKLEPELATCGRGTLSVSLVPTGFDASLPE